MYFDTTYKKAARRVNLLRSIRPSVDQKCAKTIYITMILLTFTCCVTWSWLVRHPKKSHKNIEQRSLTIIGNKGLKSSINRNQSYAQKRVTGL